MRTGGIPSRLFAHALVVLLGAAVFVPVAALRFLDGDEGDYAAAADLVAHGRVLYHDFLYTQTPVLPYVYGYWGRATGETWTGLRGLSAALAIALTLLVYVHVSRRLTGAWGFVAVTLVVFSTLAFTWYPTVKTYALSTFLLFAAFVLLDRLGRVGTGAALAAGALAALSVQTRSLVVGGAVVLAWAAWRKHVATTFGIGFLIGALPGLVFLAIDRERFLFGNLWYHRARSEGGFVGDFEQKLGIVANLLGIPTEARPLPQYLLMIGAVAVAVFVGRRKGASVPLALWTAAGLGIVALVPTPTYSQYFATTVPFLAVGLTELIGSIAAGRRPGWFAAVGVGLAAYLIVAPIELRRLVISSKEDRPSAVQRVGDWIAARVQPGDEVVAAWAGYLYGTGARPLPGLENAFAPHEAAAISTEKAARFHVASTKDVEAAIRSGRTKLVVVKVWNDLEPIPEYEAAARDGGYRLATVIETVRLYERRP